MRWTFPDICDAGQETREEHPLSKLYSLVLLNAHNEGLQKRPSRRCSQTERQHGRKAFPILGQRRCRRLRSERSRHPVRRDDHSRPTCPPRCETSMELFDRHGRDYVAPLCPSAPSPDSVCHDAAWPTERAWSMEM
jgi:hypothetical protein